MSDTAARDVSMKSIMRAFPSLSQKLDLHRQLATVKPELEIIEERLRFQVQEFDPGIHGYVNYALDSKRQADSSRPRAAGGARDGEVDAAACRPGRGAGADPPRDAGA